MSKISEALEAWRQALRVLEATPPGGDRDRARAVEEQRHADYQTAVAESQRLGDEAMVDRLETVAVKPRDLTRRRN